MDEADDLGKQANHCADAILSYARWFRGGRERLTMLQSCSVLYGESVAVAEVVDVARTCEQRRGWLAGVAA